MNTDLGDMLPKVKHNPTALPAAVHLGVSRPTVAVQPLKLLRNITMGRHILEIVNLEAKIRPTLVVKVEGATRVGVMLSHDRRQRVVEARAMTADRAQVVDAAVEQGIKAAIVHRAQAASAAAEPGVEAAIAHHVEAVSAALEPGVKAAKEGVRIEVTRRDRWVMGQPLEVSAAIQNLRVRFPDKVTIVASLATGLQGHTP